MWGGQDEEGRLRDAEGPFQSLILFVFYKDVAVVSGDYVPLDEDIGLVLT